MQGEGFEQRMLRPRVEMDGRPRRDGVYDASLAAAADSFMNLGVATAAA